MSGGESKSSPKMFDELLTYCTLGMLASCFRNVPAGCHRYFRVPPFAYGLAACSHIGYLVSIEWVGKLFMSVVSQPFFLGSSQHRDAIAALPDHDFKGDVVDLPVRVPVFAWPADPSSTPRVLWTSEPSAGCFFKIIRGDGWDGPYFRRIHAAYSTLSAARSDVRDPPPASLVDATLLFGAGEVCVRMPWVAGRDACMADLVGGGVAVEPVADAVAWLARHGLLYTDLRPLNVRVCGGGGVALIDYDDLVVVVPPPTSFAELINLLRDNNAGFAMDGAGSLPAVVDALATRFPVRG